MDWNWLSRIWLLSLFPGFLGLDTTAACPQDWRPPAPPAVDMPSTQEVLMTPVNATLGAVGFAGALTVIPLVAWPLRYYSAKKVGDMTPEVKMFLVAAFINGSFNYRTSLRQRRRAIWGNIHGKHPFTQASHVFAASNLGTWNGPWFYVVSEMRLSFPSDLRWWIPRSIEFLRLFWPLRFACVCSRMYDLSDDIRGHPVTVGPWKLEKRVTNKVAIFSSASKVLLAFEGTQLRGESWLKDLLRDLQVMLNLEDIASDETLKKCFDALAEFPDADNIYVTGHSLGGVWAYLVAKYAAKFGEARPIRGEVFNPGLRQTFARWLYPKNVL